MEAAYVLHRRQYRETSLLLEVFTYQFGRISLLAKGAYTSRSGKSSLLQPLQPLLIEWSGRGELKTLTKVEAPNLALGFQGEQMYAALYFNELLFRLTPAQENLHEVFELYVNALGALSEGNPVLDTVIVFEVGLARRLGLLGDFGFDWQGKKIKPDAEYYLSEEFSFVETAEQNLSNHYSGELLLSLNRIAGSLDLTGEDVKVVLQSKSVRRLIKQIFDSLLDGVELQSKKILYDLLKAKMHKVSGG